MKKRKQLKRIFSATLAIVLTIGSASVLYASEEVVNTPGYVNESETGFETEDGSGSVSEPETIPEDIPEEENDPAEYLQALPVSVRTIEIADLSAMKYKDAFDRTCSYRLYDAETILLPLNADADSYLTFDLSVKEDGIEEWKTDRWKIYPDEAAQEVLYSSSNPGVISVTPEGLVEPHKSGTATITILASDGSGVRNTIKFRAVTPVRKIEIADKAGLDQITAGDSLKPSVIFNNGDHTPDSKELQWSLKQITDPDGTEDLTDELRDKVTVDEKTGATSIRADYGDEIVKITITAVSHETLPEETPVAADHTFIVYPANKPFETLTVTGTGGNPVITPGKSLTFSAKTDSTFALRDASFDWFFTEKEMNPHSAENRFHESSLFRIVNGKLTATAALSDEPSPVQIDIYAGYAYAEDAFIFSAPITVTAYPSAAVSILCDPVMMDMIGRTATMSPVLTGKDGKPCCPDGLTYKSSNTRVAVVDAAGNVQAVSNGTAYVTVTAGDNSRKSAKVKITVAQKPLSVCIKAKDGVKTLGAGKKLQFSASVNTDPGEHAAANSKVNWKITGISEAEGSEIPEADFAKVARITNTGVLYAAKNPGGIFLVKIRAQSVAAPTVESPDTLITVYPLTDRFILTDNHDLTAKRFSRNLSAGIPLGSYPVSFTISSSGTTEDFAVCSKTKDGAAIDAEYAVTSSRPAVAAVEVTESNPDTGLPCKWTVRALSKGNCVIRINACDGSGKSAAISVNVIKPVTDLQIFSKSGCYIAAGKCRLQLKAVINPDASDQKAEWTIEEVLNDGVTVSDPEKIVTISNTGLIKVADINTQYTARIRATAKDGSGISDTVEIGLYPYAVSHVLQTVPVQNVRTILTKGSTKIHVDALSYDEKNSGTGSVLPKDRSAQVYKVTYTPGAAKVTLLNQDGNEVRVTGLKKGSTTVTFTAMDGSGKKVTYKIGVLGNAQKSGWMELNGRKYYVSPETGEPVTGFKKIDGRLYYFLEEGDLEASLAKGFFNVGSSSPFFDGTPHASNRYYANEAGQISDYALGEILRPEDEPWRTIKKEPAKADSQEWTYYFADRTLTVDGEEFEIGEVLAGNWYIHDDVQEYVPDIETETAERRAHIYSFHDLTGARKRMVLYFAGNYYGHVDKPSMQAQKAAVDSIARYFNADEALAEIPDELVYVNYRDTAAKKDGDDADALQVALQNRLKDLGLTRYDPLADGTGTAYPMAASEYVENEKQYDLDENGWPYLNKIIYKEADDIAKWDDAESVITDGKDRNVDVLDVEMFACDVYRKAIQKAGPKNLVLMGASSGGGTVLALCRWAAANGLEQPEHAILLSPWLDVALDNPQARNTDGNNGTDCATLRYWGARYTRDAAYEDDQGEAPYAANSGRGVEYAFASPFNYSEYALNPEEYKEEFNALTTEFAVFAGKNDPCFADANLFAGVVPSCTIRSYAGRPHGYMFHNKYNPEAARTWQAIAEIIMTE